MKYIHTYDESGRLTFREYYNLTADPQEFTNLLNDGNAANDPPAAELSELSARLNGMATCAGRACLV